MRFVKICSAVLAVLVVIYFLGPHPSTPHYTNTLPAIPSGSAALQQFVSTQESKHTLKPDNEARIVWANDSTRQKTDYSIVYLHGFSASQEEGNPVHRNIAKQFGCNLYLSRLAAHGIDTADALINFTPENLWESAKEAYAIGKQLGKKVILMGTSTGGTLALQLAAAFPDVEAILLLSPNIAINDPNAWLLNKPWGLQLARLVKKGNYNIIPNSTPAYKQYWNDVYRLEATTQLQELLATTMNTATFAAIKQPVLVLYYYKDETHQDNVVKVSAMKEMFGELGTAPERKRMLPIPDAGNHVLGSPIVSKDIVTPEKDIASFLSTVLAMDSSNRVQVKQ